MAHRTTPPTARRRLRAGGALLLALGLVLSLASVTGAGADELPSDGTATLKPAHVGATNPGFEYGTCPTPPAGAGPWGWHFVLPGNDTVFVTVTATFLHAGVVTDFISHPTGKHAYVYTNGPDTLLAAEATVAGPADEFVLSHVCKDRHGGSTTSSSTPSSSTPSSSTPSSSTPSSSTPSSSTPSSSTPSSSTPSSSTPSSSTPSSSTPSSSTPSSSTPSSSTPSSSTPPSSSPTSSTPSSSTPSSSTPSSSTPSSSTPSSSSSSSSSTSSSSSIPPAAAGDSSVVDPSTPDQGLLGASVSRELPRTGSSPLLPVLGGLGLVVVGLVLLDRSRRLA